MNNTQVLKETTSEYGTVVLYDGDIPTYTSEEAAFKYYLFKGWDKSGLVDGDKDIIQLMMKLLGSIMDTDLISGLMIWTLNLESIILANLL